MEYLDEKIADIKQKNQILRFKDIRNDGIFINGEFIEFQAVNIFQEISMYLPKDFIDMPNSVCTMKYQSTYRPEVIKTSLNTSENFVFNRLDKISEEDAEVYIAQIKEVVKRVNPSFRYIEEREELTLQGKKILMFDFINSGIDDQIYNMMCLIPLDCGTLQAGFNCLERDSDEWKDIAWKALLTIEEIK